MRSRAKRVREGQARERKMEEEPAYFGAHVEKRGLCSHVNAFLLSCEIFCSAYRKNFFHFLVL
jgi:hypothetical protein